VSRRENLPAGWSQLRSRAFSVIATPDLAEVAAVSGPRAPGYLLSDSGGGLTPVEFTEPSDPRDTHDVTEGRLWRTVTKDGRAEVTEDMVPQLLYLVWSDKDARRPVAGVRVIPSKERGKKP